MPPKKHKPEPMQQDLFAGPAGAFVGLIALGAVSNALKQAENNTPPEDQYFSKTRNNYDNKEFRKAKKQIHKDDGDDLLAGTYVKKDGKLVRTGNTKVLNRYHGTPQPHGTVISKFKLKPTGFKGRDALNSLPTLYTTHNRVIAEQYAYGASANTPDDTGTRQHQIYSLGLTPSEIVDLGDCDNNKDVRHAHKVGADVIECEDFEDVPETVVFNKNIVHIKDIKDGDTGQSIPAKGKEAPEDIYLTETGNPGPMARKAILNQSSEGLSNVGYLAINHNTPEETRAIIFADGSVAYERGVNSELWEGTSELEQEFVKHYKGIDNIGPRSSFNNENLLLEEFEKRTRESTIDEEQARRAMRRNEGYYDRLRAEAAARTTDEERREYEALRNELQELSDRLKRNAQKIEEDEYMRKDDIYFDNPDRMGRENPEDVYLTQTGEPSILVNSVVDHFYNSDESFGKIIKEYNPKQRVVVTNNYDNDTSAYLLNDGGIVYFDREEREPWIGNEDLEQQAAEEFKYDGYVVGPDASMVREREKIEIPETTRGLSAMQKRTIQRERRRLSRTPPEDQYLSPKPWEMIPSSFANKYFIPSSEEDIPVDVDELPDKYLVKHIINNRSDLEFYTELSNDVGSAVNRSYSRRNINFINNKLNELLNEAQTRGLSEHINQNKLSVYESDKLDSYTKEARIEFLQKLLNDTNRNQEEAREGTYQHEQYANVSTIKSLEEEKSLLSNKLNELLQRNETLESVFTSDDEDLYDEYNDRQEKGLIVQDKNDEYVATQVHEETPSAIQTRGLSRNKRRALQRERMKQLRTNTPPEDQYLNSEHEERDGDNVYDLIGIEPNPENKIDTLVNEMSGQPDTETKNIQPQQYNSRNNDHIMSDVARSRLSRKMETSQRAQDALTRQRIVDESKSANINRFFSKKRGNKYYGNNDDITPQQMNFSKNLENAMLTRGVAAQARLQAKA